ncbi:MAG: hypothetical protein ACRDHY_02595 [Anaerolineales bacterium]
MSDQPQPPSSGDLQFDRAEPAQGPAGSVCAFCKEPITTSYYDVNGLVACKRCRYKVEAEWNRGSAAGRLWRALGLGAGAALVGAIVWYAITLATDSTWGIVAVGVGLLVGAAVRKGSDGRGGWRYQTLAIALTYVAIAAAQAPFVLEAIREAGPLEVPQDSVLVTSDTTGTVTATDSAASIQAADLGLVGLLIGLAILALLFLASPIIVGVQSFILLLIYGFALYEAWKLNQKVALRVTGPYAVGSARSA